MSVFAREREAAGNVRAKKEKGGCRKRDDQRGGTREPQAGSPSGRSSGDGSVASPRSASTGEANG
jgi:hypothetical protein